MKSETEKLSEIIRRCKCGVTVQVNEHRNCYVSAEKWIEDSRGGEREAMGGPEEIAAMIATDTIVQVQCYPSTPVGFYLVIRATLAKALDDTLEALDGEPA